MPVRLIRQFAFVLLSTILAVAPVLAADPKRNLAVASKTAAPANEARVALVIGNSAYKESPLRNPVNDAQDVAKELSRLGFKVTLKENADQKTMKQIIRDFGNQLKAGGVGLFYFAGHGMQVKGRNYLVPVGVDIQSEDEVEDQSVDVSLVLEKMESAKNRVNVVVLDACRNNPFARRFRSAAGGLGAMDAAKGSYIAYATAPNSVAADGAGRNGVYTKHLLASLRQPESDIEKVFKRVRAGVASETGGKQVPWESSSLIGDFYFNSLSKPGAASATADPAAIELVYWDSIKTSQSPEDYQAYLKKYPNGLFADIAKRRALNPPKPATAAVASLAPTEERKRHEQEERNKKLVTPDDISFELMRNMVTDYYNTRSEWVGTFTLDAIMRWRLEEVDSGRKRVHVEYRYVPVPGNQKGRRDTGVDQRTFDFVWTNGSWRVTSMGGHMSARL